METVTASVPIDRRRSSRRRRGEDHGIVSARIRPGHDVSIIDVSAGGALVEGICRMLPGAAVELQLRSQHRPVERVKGRVNRCAVARLRSDGVCYRGAIVFDDVLQWLFEEASGGYDVPDSESRGRHLLRVEATRRGV